MKVKMKWATYAGGTFAAAGKYAYDTHLPFGEYHISAVSFSNGRHKGYHLMFANTKGKLKGGLWQDLGMFRSPNAAKGAAVKHYDSIK